jgi:hypothetical protein
MYYNEKKVLTAVMVNNSTIINKRNNHLSPQINEHKKKTMIYDIGNPGVGLGQLAGLNLLMSRCWFGTAGRVKPLTVQVLVWNSWQG